MTSSPPRSPLGGVLCLGFALGTALTWGSIAAQSNPPPWETTPTLGIIPSRDKTTYEEQLAQHLTASGALLYGAYWCPHSGRQRDSFRAGADQLPYVECDPSGRDPQAQRCRDRGIQGYPTWEINGELYPGVQSLATLARLSNFAPPP